MLAVGQNLTALNTTVNTFAAATGQQVAALSAGVSQNVTQLQATVTALNNAVAASQQALTTLQAQVEAVMKKLNVTA